LTIDLRRVRLLAGSIAGSGTTDVPYTDTRAQVRNPNRGKEIVQRFAR